MPFKGTLKHFSWLFRTTSFVLLRTQLRMVGANRKTMHTSWGDAACAACWAALWRRSTASLAAADIES